MLLFTDGFDVYTALPGGKWDAVLTADQTPVISASVGRNGTPGLVIPYNSIAVHGAMSGVQKNLGTQEAIYFGFALNANLADFGTEDLILAQFLDGGTTQVDLRLTKTGNFYFTRNGTQIGSLSTQSYPGSAYHYVEVGVTINSTSGTAILRVDGVTWINLTGQNTQATGDAFATGVTLGYWPQNPPASMPQLTFDDVYIANASSPYPNTFLGNVFVLGSVPSGNGSTQQFTSSGAAWVASTAYTLGTKIVDSGGYIQQATTAGTSGSSAPSWDETVGGVTSDGSTLKWTNEGNSPYEFVNANPPNDGQTYRTDSTLSNVDLYAYPAVSLEVTVIAAVVWPRILGSGAVRGVCVSSGTTGNNGTDLAVTGSYAYAMAPILTDPNTGLPFTLAALNAAQFGVTQTE